MKLQTINAKSSLKKMQREIKILASLRLCVKVFSDIFFAGQVYSLTTFK